MEAEVYRYQFNEAVPMLNVEESLQLAILAAGCLHGEARVRMEAGYSISEEKRRIVVDGTTQVARDVCQIFTGFAIKEFGEDAFRLERITRKPDGDRKGRGETSES